MRKSYSVNCEGFNYKIRIKPGEFVPIYEVEFPKLGKATLALIEDVKTQLLPMIPIRVELLTSEAKLRELKEKIKLKARELIRKTLPRIDEYTLSYILSYLICDMLGLGKVEVLLSDDELEEVVINNAKEPIWVYHRKYGWMQTNIRVESEAQIENYARIVGRRVGRQITLLNPLMDAHLLSGDRVNATLFPISTKGNTLTIRKFRRKPWTITDLIRNKTLNYETAALLWLAVQYELSIIVAGGTASGKTTFLNMLLTFVPSTHRIVSIEETRELNLPSFLHWVPLTTREPNPEGKGEVSMHELLINSLRMRPDRIVVGEIRRKEEAEVLFEALRTGHSVYSTLHANTALEAIRRLTTPPIDLPPETIEVLPLICVMFRQRRLGIRRLFEVAEVLGVVESEVGKEVKVNTLYRWRPKLDKIRKEKDSIRVFDELMSFTGMTKEEIAEDLREKQKILRYLVKRRISDLEEIGRLIQTYYRDKEEVLKKIK